MLVESSQRSIVVQGLITPQSPHADVWLGPEITATQTVQVPPLSKSLIPIDLEQLRAEIPSERLAAFEYSGRSSIAQRGGDVLRRGATHVLDQLSSDHKTTVVPIANYSDRPLTIAQGPIAQTFTRSGTYIEGRQLLEHLEGGAIHMSGDEGKDWWIHRDSDGRPLGVGLVLEEPEKRIRKSNEPIPIPTSARGNFREQLEPHLTPIQAGDIFDIRIGTTVSEIGFDPGILGIIEQDVNANTAPEGFTVVNGKHINSILLSANDRWQIRTEVLPEGNEIPPLQPRGVVFQFMSVDVTN